ncbi:MAG TPA: archease [Terriglobales bacterium]|nr:archease [Terriglobales bacterium]
MPNFRFLEDIAIADAAFEAYGNTLEELFESCALATFEVMVDTKSIKPEQKEVIQIENSSLEDLLFDFISELVYLKDTCKLFFSNFDLRIEKNNEYKLSGTVRGEKIDYSKQEIRRDVKAVTYHMLEVKKIDNSSWRAQVILDT